MYIQITDKCNMRCAHCCMSCTGKGTFMTQAVFDKALDLAKRYGMDITIGGGEPTLHPKVLEWCMQAALACLDTSMEWGSPACLIVTNGKKTETAIKLAKMAHLGMIAAELSQDEYHDAINPKVVKEFTRYNRSVRDSGGFGMREKKGYADIRDVTGGIKAQGRAIENHVDDMEGCACEAMFIAPNGDFYKCGCRKTKLGNIMDIDELPESITENPNECEKDIDFDPVAIGGMLTPHMKPVRLTV